MPEVRLVHEPSGCESNLDQWASREASTPRLWTDAYLAAFAIAGGLRLVTFDRGFSRFPGLDLLLLSA
jgi:predicted nucleic acid-binding protein